MTKSVFYCHGCKATGTFRHFAQRLKDLSTSEVIPFLAEIKGGVYREPTDTAGAESVHPYPDADGDSVSRKIKYPGKQFRWQRFENGKWQWGLAKDTPKHLYNLPRIKGADTVSICEGEKDCDHLDRLMLRDGTGKPVTATTAGGAGDWQHKFAADLLGKRVIVLPHVDAAGHKCRDSIVESLNSVGIEHKVIDLSPYNDVADFLAARSGAELAARIGQEWVVPGTMATTETEVVTDF